MLTAGRGRFWGSDTAAVFPPRPTAVKDVPPGRATVEPVLVVDARIQIPLRELDIQFVRSSGPGGQNVNKVSTKAVLRWPVMHSPSLPDDVRQRFAARYPRRITRTGDLVIHSQRFRDQGRNVADCLEKLRELLASVARPPARRRPSKPSRAGVERRLEQKKRQGERKTDRRKPRPDD